MGLMQFKMEHKLAFEFIRNEGLENKFIEFCQENG